MMNLLQKARRNFNEFFYNHYPLMIILWSIILLITAFVQYEYKVHNYDLIRWKRLVETATADTDGFQLMILFIIMVINLISIGAIFKYFMQPLHEETDLSLLDIKERYARFILLSLIARLDRIQQKLSHRRKRLTFLHYVRAHGHMVKAVAIFRKKVRKLLLPNESELTMPIDRIYFVADDEEQELRRGGYFKLPIDVTDAAVSKLFNPI